MAMKFCPRCDAFGIPDYNKKQSVCNKCGHLFEQVIKKVKKDPNNLEKKVFVVKKKDRRLNHLPRGNYECSKCGNMEAYISIVTARDDDDDNTERYQCTNCGHSWRQRT